MRTNYTQMNISHQDLFEGSEESTITFSNQSYYQNIQNKDDEAQLRPNDSTVDDIFHQKVENNQVNSRNNKNNREQQKGDVERSMSIEHYSLQSNSLYKNDLLESYIVTPKKKTKACQLSRIIFQGSEGNNKENTNANYSSVQRNDDLKNELTFEIRKRKKNMTYTSSGKLGRIGTQVSTSNIINHPASIVKILTRRQDSSNTNNAADHQSELHSKFERILNKKCHSNENTKRLTTLVHKKRKSENKQPKEFRKKGGKVCAICLSIPEEKVYGIVKCQHEFCWECILDWSKVTNQCPMCRYQFKQVEKKNYHDSFDKNIIEVEDRKQKILDDDEFYWEEVLYDSDIDEICYICKTDYDENKLMICDKCGVKICHTYCDDMLHDDEIPEEDWFCHTCRREQNN